MPSNKKPKKGAKDMMNETTVKKGGLCTVDLAQLNEEGSFPCPKCGTMISPDDESEEVYKILETKVVNDELVGLVISCNTCRTVVRLTGFQQTMEGLTSEQ